MNKKLLVIVTALVFFSPVAQASYSSYAARAAALYVGITLIHMNSKFKKPNPNPVRPACDSFKGFLNNLEYFGPTGDFNQPDLDPKVANIDPVTGQPSKWYDKCSPHGLGLLAAHGKAFDGISKAFTPLIAFAGVCAVAGIPVGKTIASFVAMFDITKATDENVKTNFGPKALGIFGITA